MSDYLGQNGHTGFAMALSELEGTVLEQRMKGQEKEKKQLHLRKIRVKRCKS